MYQEGNDLVLTSFTCLIDACEREDVYEGYVRPDLGSAFVKNGIADESKLQEAADLLAVFRQQQRKEELEKEIASLEKRKKELQIKLKS